MKVECYECEKEFDKDSDDIIYKVVERSMVSIFYGFICRDCKDKALKAKKNKEEQIALAQKQLEDARKNMAWWQKL